MATNIERTIKGPSNTPFSLPWSLLSGEVTVYLVHFMVQVAIGESSFVHTCRCFVEQFCWSSPCEDKLQVFAAWLDLETAMKPDVACTF
jgi:hypothetical protein